MVAVVNCGRLNVAPASALRIAPATVVVPVTVSETPEPLAVSEPPVMVKPPLNVEFAATDSDPPLIEIGSVLLIELTDCVPEAIAIVGLPLLLIVTLSLGPGTASSDQFLTSVQVVLSPWPVQDTFERSVRGSRISTVQWTAR